jgi:hypothetical protein
MVVSRAASKLPPHPRGGKRSLHRQKGLQSGFWQLPGKFVPPTLGPARDQFSLTGRNRLLWVGGQLLFRLRNLLAEGLDRWN